jgi:hypothetical protein
MQFNCNNFDYKHARLVLAKPYYLGANSKIGLISGVREFKIKPFFNSISEVSFKLYKYYNGIKNKWFDEIVTDKIIYIKNTSYFQVKKIEEKHDVNSKVPYKEITCLTSENELIYKKIQNVNGVFSLYDVSDTEHSLLHIIMNNCGWTVKHIDNSLLGRYRTLSIDSEKIYNFLTGKIAESYQCLFQFDTFDKTISVY